MGRAARDLFMCTFCNRRRTKLLSLDLECAHQALVWTETVIMEMLFKPVGIALFVAV